MKPKRQFKSEVTFPEMKAFLLHLHRNDQPDFPEDFPENSHVIEQERLVTQLFDQGIVRPWCAVARQNPYQILRVHAFLYNVALHSLKTNRYQPPNEFAVHFLKIERLRAFVKRGCFDLHRLDYFYYTGNYEGVATHKEFGDLLKELAKEKARSIIVHTIGHAWDETSPLFENNQ